MDDCFNLAEKRTVNLNGQMDDVVCSLVTDGQTPVVHLRFHNVSQRVIVGVRMKGVGKNAFGEAVTDDGKDTLTVDLFGRVAPGETGEMTTALESPAIRSVELKWAMIGYEDGTTAEPLSPRTIECEIPVFSDSPEDREGQRLLSDRYQKPIRNRALEIKGGWICTCGYFNAEGSDPCVCCGMSRADALEASNPETAERLRREEREREELELRQRSEALMAAEARKKRILAIAAAAIIIILIIVISSKTASDRKKAREAYMKGVRAFQSAEEMQSTINGRYAESMERWETTYYHPDPNRYIVINGDTFTEYNLSNGAKYPNTITKLTPEDGRFTVGSAVYKVNTSGSITSTYDNPEYSILNTTYNKISSSTDPLDVEAMVESREQKQRLQSETASTALSFSIGKPYSSGSYTVCEGKVTNNGMKTYTFVKVKGAFVDRSGTVLDTDWTYAIGSEGLAPGETTTFHLSVKSNGAIKDCKISIM